MTDTTKPENNLPILQKSDFTIELKGDRYPVERFTDAHMLAMLEMFTTKMTDIQSQSKAGCVIKEIIVPSISDEYINTNPNGLYVIHLDIQTMNYLVLQLIRAYHYFDLKDIKEGKKPKALLAETQERIEAVQEGLNVMQAQTSLEKTINLSVFTPEEQAEAKNIKILELQEQLKKLQNDS